MPLLPDEALDTRRLILLRLSREKHVEILLNGERTDRGLPEVRIPRCQRVAEQLTVALKAKCGLEAISLGPLEPLTDSIVYEVMEAHGPQNSVPRDLQWARVDLIADREFHDRCDYEAVIKAVAQARPSVERSPGPFARLGWFRELEHWVEEQIRPRRLRLSGRIRQLNASAGFSLIRFETNGPPLWFKAASGSNLHEFRLTLTLSQLFSQFVPQIIGSRPEWNGWLALNVEGPLLDQGCDPHPWKAAAHDLASLQVASLNSSSELLTAGARDLGSGALRKRVSPFFESIGDLMKQQTRVPPDPLSQDQLHVLSGWVSNALDILEETQSPLTLGQLDLNPGNVILAPTGTVFFDWAEGFVGHPFFAIQYLVEHFRRRFGENRALESQLLESYLAPWHSFVPDRAIHCALEVAPLLAVFAYATGSEPWTDPRKLNQRRTGENLRSLTRRMYREADLLSERSLSCPN